MSGYVGSKRSSSLVSATEITLDGAKLKSSGNSITKSDGTTAVLSESSGTVTFTTNTAIIEGSSSGDLVRITQTGSGNALVVEDDTSPDSTPFVISASGNVLVGQTTGSSNDTGHIFFPNGIAFHVRDGGVGLVVDRQTSDGDIVQFRKDGTTLGSIGSTSLRLYIADETVGLRFAGDADAIAPWNGTTNTARDNAIDLGQSNIRFDDIYATNGTIQTSDLNEKQDIEELTEAEQRVAVAAKSLMRKFRWKSAVAKKGDEARIHFGIIAQDLQAAFEAEGLDAGRYAMFISSTWWEATETYTDDDGVEQTRTNTYDTAEEAPEGAMERTRLGVRYSEMLAFIIAAL